MPAFSRSVGYLGHAWCRSDSQILARNGVFVVTVACKSKTTQSELCLDEASAVCQARTPRRRRMRIRSENSLCRLWDFERPRPQIPIPRHRKDFVVVCCCVYREPGRGGRARFTPPAGYWVRWRRPSERAHTRCAVHSDHAERWRGPRAERRRGSRAERWRGPRAERRRPTAAATAGNSRAAAAPGPRGAIAIAGPLGSVPGRA